MQNIRNTIGRLLLTTSTVNNDFSDNLFTHPHIHLTIHSSLAINNIHCQEQGDSGYMMLVLGIFCAHLVHDLLPRQWVERLTSILNKNDQNNPPQENLHVNLI